AQIDHKTDHKIDHADHQHKASNDAAYRGKEHLKKCAKNSKKVRKTKRNSRAKRNRYVMIDFYARNDQSKGG
ncbi:hypothetical protein ACTV7A_005567, partial [Escherichia coli]